jgi:ATP:cob(I)alamin adenosyltransferase
MSGRTGGSHPHLNLTRRHALRSSPVEIQDRTEWTIGELADAAGITVRTLRHYDHIGLLVPDDRSVGGHRRYSAVEVERLYRIVALRGLGFGLAEIAAMLDADRGQLIETVGRQLKALEIEVEAQIRLRDRLARMLGRLERDERLSTAELIETMEEISMPITIDRVYTRTGDAGETELADGSRIPKTDPRLAAGDLEELSAHLGVAAARSELPREHVGWLLEVQNDLLDIGAELGCGPQVDDEPLPRLTAAYGDWLEDRCDEANQDLPPLQSFVLPGDDPLAAQLHVCRTVCRRVERHVLAGGPVNPEVARYLNRLSDLLFILARRADSGSERRWEPGRRRQGRS